ncbi:peroxisomal coenzyme A diphosphatase NUDT7 isoform X4 [Pelodiscus sinensis]|uniref:peroxisomal coenzyme A diphosphatase NUDT7 isoform X4 n=1 Tax=Pelodiscus sinensis TaxID=13735 RepID=UPI000D721753|nr:peroxisomal coenzyme A diphosphatase NUDT7 isoform X2 [Pelodiscus sinensis]|eukprot:XP_025040117.1 peroxisomal coenzyme A diphosphatase NUDT7 isoform X2 [Pelodiscus sinensis]
MAALRDAEDERGRNIKDKAKINLRKHDIGNKFSHLPLAKASILMPLMVKDGKLHVLFTVRSMKIGSLVTPVVGFIEDTFQPKPNPDEVSDVFLVPLEYFIEPLKYMTLPYKRADGVASWLHSFIYDDPERKTSLRIWGLTAHFAVFLALVIFEKKPTFDINYDLDNLFSSSEKSFMEQYMSLYKGSSSKL